MTFRFIYSVLLIALVACSSNKGGDNASTGPEFVGKAPVIFSEITPVNIGLKDAYDDDPGWIELYNPADTAVQLAGYSLSDRTSALRTWVFGDVTVPAQGRIVVFLSGRDQQSATPARDSIDLIGTSAWGWGDSQNDPAGFSTAAPNAFPDYLGSLQGKTAISGTITLADNSSTDLTWSSASIFLGLTEGSSADVVDLSGQDQIVLRGYLDAGVELEVRLAQPDMDDWLGWYATITGSGKADDLYTIDLPESGLIPDLKNIYGLRFANAANQYRTVNFTFTRIYARKRGTDLHASIKLSKSGGSLYLSDSTGALRDSVAYTAVPATLSYARDGLDQNWSLRAPPTPGSVNSQQSYTRQLQAPGDLPASGLYAAPLKITLPAPIDTGAVLRCDTTGAAPTVSSPISGGELVLSRTTVLRCANFHASALASPVTLRSYLIDERSPALPVVAIAANPGALFDPDTGIYMPGPHPGADIPYWGANYWWDKEIPVQIDFFEPGAKLAWSSGAGLKIFGNFSRAQDKKSVALVFREQYGQKRLDYPLFPEHPELRQFKWFILRNNGSNNGRDYLRDALMSSLTRGLGIDYQKARPAIVYYNGAYFGIHDIREKSNEYYFETNYGYDPAQIDLVKANGEATAGSNGDYQQVMDWIAAHPLQEDANYQWVRTRLDIDNFTNYVQSEMFFVNKDWPGNNLKRWRSRAPQTLWKWFIYDTDFAFGAVDESPKINMLQFATAEDGPDWPNPPHSTFLLRSLLTNDSYRQAFINRFAVLLATSFAPATVQARIDKMMGNVQSEIPLDQKRWKLSSTRMNAELAEIEAFGAERAGRLQAEIQSFFELSESYPLSLSLEGSGSIQVHGLPISSSITWTAYSDIPIRLTAVAAPGSTFVGWENGSTEPERIVSVTEAMNLRASFR